MARKAAATGGKRASAGGAREFVAVLERLEGGLGWVIARLEFDPASAWPQMVRQRVRGTVARADWPGAPRAEFRTSLFASAEPDRPGHFLLVNRRLQEAAGIGLGARAAFTLEPDMEPRPAELPEMLAALLEDEPGLRAFYDGLTEYTRREIGKWVLGVKSDEAQMRRAEQMAERLLATMEAEVELPPLIAGALRRRPKAAAGWNAMTPLQRRHELMAVFYYRTPESQAKRLQKLCDLAETKA